MKQLYNLDLSKLPVTEKITHYNAEETEKANVCVPFIICVMCVPPKGAAVHVLAGPGARWAWSARGPPRPLQAAWRPYLVKVGDDLVEQAQALQPFLVDVALCVEDFKVRHRCKHDTHAVVGRMVPVLEWGRGRHRTPWPPGLLGAGRQAAWGADSFSRSRSRCWWGREGLSSGSPPDCHETQLGTITKQEVLNQFVEEGGTQVGLGLL